MKDVKDYQGLRPEEKENKGQNSIEKPFLTVGEACLYLEVSKSTMYKYIHKREFPVFKPNNKLVYIAPEELNKWVLRNKVESKEEIESNVEEALERYGQEKQLSTAGNTGTFNKTI